MASVTLSIEADIDQVMVTMQRMAGKDIASPTTERANLAALPPPPQSKPCSENGRRRSTEEHADARGRVENRLGASPSIG